MTEALQHLHNPLLALPAAALLGLIIGSFLTVLIHRLPLMLHRQWQQQCHELLQHHAPNRNEERFDLAWPGSHCPHCGHRLSWRENIPLLGYLRLKGRCAACQQAISSRYPVVELLAAISAVVAVLHFGPGYQALAAATLGWGLIALAAIDIEHQLLPDALTLPLLWLGLLVNSSGLLVPPGDAIIGASAGYLALWLVYQGFKLTTGKEGMGRGDFKLLALLGAWLGWQLLPAIVVLAALAGVSLGLARVLLKKQRHDQAMPFGPYLALAGWLALIWGPALLDLYPR